MLNPIRTSDFDAIKLKLASPEDILSWSHGEIVRPETINYRTQKPEKDGLFCEKIFGPSKDWECYCGKYKKIRYKGIVCDKCGVEVTRSIVRRERMGHISLQSPCSHIWFLRGISSKIGSILDLTMNSLEKVVYFTSFIVTDVDEDLKNATIDQIKQEFKSKKKSIESEFSSQEKEIKNRKAKLLNEGKGKDEVEKVISTELSNLEELKEEKVSELMEAFSQAQKELKELKPLLIISENAYYNLSLKYGHIFEAGIGAEAIRKLLSRIDLGKTIEAIEVLFDTVVASKKEKMSRRLRLLKSLNNNGVRPEWMILEEIPVIPPDLRPMVALDGGRFATSDLNDLYRRVINRNNRLKQLIELNAPEVICRNEKRMLQEAVDALIDNSARHAKTVTASTGQKRQLKSLADSLKGKQGRFRQNLLGKRIDYSGRSVIVVNPHLHLQECGLPKIMALELFKPFVISKLIKRELVHNVRSATRYIEAGHNEVWDILEEVIKGAYVMLNRAPTLHRLGIQAFRPQLIEGKAIQIHPLVCSAFNADFDGDQMAVHVPLTEEAVAEARDIMLASHNLLKPATGDPVVAPSQDIVWGGFYLTASDATEKEDKELKHFSSEVEAKIAYEAKVIALNDPIMAIVDKKLIKTTVGRIIFNEILPEKLRFINEIAGKNELKNLIKKSLRYYGEDTTVELVDNLKNLCFKYITKSGLSWSMEDLPYFGEKDKIINEAIDSVDEIQEQFDDGLLTESERYAKVIEIWTNVKEKVTNICKVGLPKEGPVFSMIESGARGSWAQLTQILGMKGLVTSPSGDIIEMPVKGNFKKGFGVLEYFISTHGVRKGLSDTALRTANAGYLTRRLVDVAQDIIVTDEDCGDVDGVIITKKESDDMNYPLVERIVGRYMASDLKNSKGKVLVKEGELITEDIFDEIKGEDIEEANIRSVLSCKLHRGTCAKCYGYDLSYNKPVKIGTAVGVIAAQSIGEPGTQLTMRTFHSGGVAGGDDITQGLPRVEEIFEVRPPKKQAILSDVDGKVTIGSAQKTVTDIKGKTITSSTQGKILQIAYRGEDMYKYKFSDFSTKNEEIKPKNIVKDGALVSAGEELFKVGKKIAVSEFSGRAVIGAKGVEVAVEGDKIKEYLIPQGTGISVEDGAEIKKGDRLTDGSINLRESFLLRGVFETQKYIIKEIQHVYSSQGQPLNDKHVEIIVKQMFSRYLITGAGDTNLLPGETIERGVLLDANEESRNAKKKEAEFEQILLGITKASLTTDSFLSAASFQETARVLIEAAINGKIDYLEGLKENVIIGRLIPAGTGYKGKQTRADYSE